MSKPLATKILLVNSGTLPRRPDCPLTHTWQLLLLTQLPCVHAGVSRSSSKGSWCGSARNATVSHSAAETPWVHLYKRAPHQVVN